MTVTLKIMCAALAAALMVLGTADFGWAASVAASDA